MQHWKGFPLSHMSAGERTQKNQRGAVTINDERERDYQRTKRQQGILLVHYFSWLPMKRSIGKEIWVLVTPITKYGNDNKNDITNDHTNGNNNNDR